MMLGKLFAVPTRPVVEPAEIDWGGLPPDLLVAVHWRYDPALEEKFREHHFRVLALARHPLDVLLSILRFAHFDGGADRWLNRAGDENLLWGGTPRSRTTLAYACGRRFDELCRVSSEWWTRPGVHPVRYEELIADPAGELGRVADAWGWTPRAAIPEVVGGYTLDGFKESLASGGFHLWQGRSLWRELFTAAECDELRGPLRWHLETLGYALDPDPALTPDAADANWQRYWGVEMRDRLREGVRLKRQVDDELLPQLRDGEAARAHLSTLAETQQRQLAEVTLECGRLTDAYQALQADHARLATAHEQAMAAYAELERETQRVTTAYTDLEQEYQRVIAAYNSLVAASARAG
jgi:hypothetical protein